MTTDPSNQTLLWQLLLIAVLTLVNAFFAASEIAFVSLNKNRVANQAIKGDEKARKIWPFWIIPMTFCCEIST